MVSPRGHPEVVATSLYEKGISICSVLSVTILSVAALRKQYFSGRESFGVLQQVGVSVASATAKPCAVCGVFWSAERVSRCPKMSSGFFVE